MAGWSLLNQAPRTLSLKKAPHTGREHQIEKTFLMTCIRPDYPLRSQVCFGIRAHKHWRICNDFAI